MNAKGHSHDEKLRRACLLRDWIESGKPTDPDSLLELAHLMKKMGLYAKSTYANDIRSTLIKWVEYGLPIGPTPEQAKKDRHADARKRVAQAAQDLAVAFMDWVEATDGR